MHLTTYAAHLRTHTAVTVCSIAVTTTEDGQNEAPGDCAALLTPD